MTSNQEAEALLQETMNGDIAVIELNNSPINALSAAMRTELDVGWRIRQYREQVRPPVQEKYVGMGMTPLRLNPAQTRKLVHREIQRWSNVFREAKVTRNN